MPASCSRSPAEQPRPTAAVGARPSRRTGAPRWRHGRGRGVWAAAAGAALLAFAPGLARADNLSGLIWVVVIWPVGILLALTLMGLGLAALVARRPSPRLGMACYVAAGIVGVAYPLFVEALGDERGRAHGIDVVTIVPVAILVVLCVLAGVRARRQPKLR